MNLWKVRFVGVIVLVLFVVGFLANEVALAASHEEITTVFADYVESDYSESITALYSSNSLNGYPDGTLRQYEYITRAEFIKMLIHSLYGEQTGCYITWACSYIVKGREVGILGENEITRDTVNEPVTKQEVAKWIVLATRARGEETTNIDEEMKIFSDLDIDIDYKTYLIEAVKKGLLSGDSSNNFGDTGYISREEATEIVIRVLDENKRVFDFKLD